MDQENNIKEHSKKQYGLGDLLWTKIGNFPFWPCMVSYDPYEACYYRKKKVRSGEVYIYHVQYFGKQVQHGWTTPCMIHPFRGEQDFYVLRDSKKIKKPGSAEKIDPKYNIAATIQDAWLIAVKEAEAAMKVEVQERFESYVFKYDPNLKKSASSKSDSSKKGKSEGYQTKPKKTKVMCDFIRVCKICNKENVDLKCSAPCWQYFHKECLGLVAAPEKFKCSNCQEGLSTCFICKKAGTCSFVCGKCNYQYHEDCIKKFPCMKEEKNECSFHTCLTCYNKNIKSKSKGTFVRCIKCPTSFHATLNCTPVGSLKLSSSTLICPDHFMGKNKISPQVTSNASYCYACSEGGELICCESCPNSYHAKCINTKTVPTGDFFCENCMSRHYLYVGMIVWAKTGNFRWWPAQISETEELPANVKNMVNYPGEFPVQYYGTDEYFWTHRGRVIPYADYHKTYGQSHLKQCRLDYYYKISLEEAAVAYDHYVSTQEILNSVILRDSYKHIKVNRAVPPAQIFVLTGKSVLPCSCNPHKPNPCGPSSGCLNRSMLMECHPDVCLAGDRCENQKFQKRTYAKVSVFETNGRGWGLLAEQFIPKGMFVIEYVGEVITHEEYYTRVFKMRIRHERNYYFLYLDSRRMIDAGPQGNWARFINHACSANCEMSKWSVSGDSRIGIFAIKDILPGEELTFNYQSDTIQFQQKCFCGTENCQGIIGRKEERPRKKFKLHKKDHS